MNNLIEALYRFLIHEESEPSPINLGKPKEGGIVECARKMLTVTGCKSEIVLKPLPQDDPKAKKLDITKARGVLGWKPRIVCREGLKKTSGCFRVKLEGSRA